MRNKVKHCPGCNRHLWVALPSSLEEIPENFFGPKNKRDERSRISFNRKLGTTDGLQPYCLECDWNGKTTIEEAWNNLVRQLKSAGEMANLSKWTFEIYQQKMGAEPHCTWCGSRCRDWGIGHWIDRQSNGDGHHPDNCVPCCSPCNFRKGQQDYEVYATTFLRPVIKSCPQLMTGMGQCPWGQVPHSSYPSNGRKFRRIYPPDLSSFVVANPQTDMFSLLVSA